MYRSAVVFVASLFGGCALVGCASPAIQRINFDPSGRCAGAPVVEKVGPDRAIVLCVDLPTANLIHCTRAVSLASESRDETHSQDVAVGAAKRVVYTDFGPLLEARASGIAACRRDYQRARAREGAASMLAEGQRDVAPRPSEEDVSLFVHCMSGLENVDRPGKEEDGSETARETHGLRARVVGACIALLHSTSPDARSAPSTPLGAAVRGGLGAATRSGPNSRPVDAGAP